VKAFGTSPGTMTSPIVGCVVCHVFELHKILNSLESCVIVYAGGLDADFGKALQRCFVIEASDQIGSQSSGLASLASFARKDGRLTMSQCPSAALNGFCAFACPEAPQP
jgi:hypothetical protein